jgi:hypothetical protein
MSKNNRPVYFAVILFILGLVYSGASQAQTYLYFQDSPDADFYDYSWMELSPPSELERKGEPDLRKFPVESVLSPQQGVNSLRLKWRSVTGGNWLAIAAGSGWTAHDISKTDSLVFWVQSIEGISAADLPKVFMEDVTNRKSTFIPVSEWSDNLTAGNWIRIVIPMTHFLTSGDDVDYTKIKTLGFAQDASDGNEHTLLIDNMRVNEGNGLFPPVSAPQEVMASGYECHIEVSWDLNQETGVIGYKIERSLDDGLNYVPVYQADANTSIYIDWVKDLGDNVEADYRVMALNGGNEPSPPSTVVSASTRTLSDGELLDMVQQYTFRYFWDFAHEESGMARERNTSGNTVTSGGSGFGIMTIPVGIERGYITREQGITRTLKILNFLSTADRFHGAWSHWIHGNTGKVIPFSTKDNGGDIVETSFMAQGLLAIRQYFNGESAEEQQIVQMATDLWEGIEWDWYRRDGTNSIYWHWSPTYNWDMNMTVSGWNEAAIVYLLAIASPTHGVPADMWSTGWARNSNYTNGKSYYGHPLYVGKDYGGPLFFAHYSFLGFDPGDKSDGYANYFDQNRNHSLIQQAYCADNPKGFKGYSMECWGLTASDDPDGYLAHEPNSSRDNGTITPTAALSSFPYTPGESMLALKHIYRNLGDKTWGWMGFKDAFNEHRNWYADSYLAIDQGPIILMIENHRSRLLWDLFMSNPEIQPMMDAIGFYYSPNSVKEYDTESFLSVYPNPSAGHFQVVMNLETLAEVQMDLFTVTGQKVHTLLQKKELDPGRYSFEIEQDGLVPGVYIATTIINKHRTETIKIIIH